MEDYNKNLIIYRKEYGIALNNFKEAYKNTISSDETPSMFSVVSSGGRGKSIMASRLIDDINEKYTACKHIIKYDLSNDEVSGKYCSLVVFITMISAFAQYLHTDYKENKDAEAKKLFDECADSIKYWNYIVSKINIPKAISIKEKLDVKGNVIDVVLSVGSQLISKSLEFSHPISVAVASTLIGKAKEFLSKQLNKIEIIDTDSYLDNFVDITNTIDISQPNVCLKGLSKRYLDTINKILNYYHDDPFLIILDNAESLNCSNDNDGDAIDRENFRSLLQRKMTVVWYLSGRLIPLGIDSYYQEKRFKFIEPIQLEGFNREQVREIFNRTNTKIEDRAPSDEEIDRLIENTKGNPLWIAMHITAILEEIHSFGKISVSKYNEIIDETDEDLVKRILRIDVGKDSWTDFEKNRILFGVLSNSSWELFEEVRKALNIDRTGHSGEIYSIDSEGGYYVHGDVAELIEKIIKKYRKDKESLVYYFTTEIINKIEELLLANVQEGVNNEFTNAYIQLTTKYLDYEEFCERWIKIKDDYKEFYTNIEAQLINKIIENTLDIRFIQDVMYSKACSDFQKADYFLKLYQHYFETFEFNNAEEEKEARYVDSRLKIEKAKLKEENIEIDAKMLNSNFSLLKREKDKKQSIFIRTKVNDDLEKIEICNESFIKFIFSNCSELIKTIGKINETLYIEKRKEYLEILDSIKEKFNNTIIQEAVERSNDEIVYLDYEFKGNWVECLEYYKNRISELEDESVILDRYFYVADIIFYRLNIIDYDNKGINIICKDFFNKVFEKYKDNYNETNKYKYFKYFTNYREFVLRFGMLLETHELLMNNIQINNDINDLSIVCLYDYYSKFKVDDKAVKLTVLLYNDYCKNSDDEKTKEHVLELLQDQNDLFTQIIIRYINSVDEIADYDEFREIINVLFDQSNNAYSILYSKIKDIVTKDITSESINTLLDIYYACAFISHWFGFDDNTISRIIGEVPSRCSHYSKEYEILLSRIAECSKSDDRKNKLDEEFNNQIKLENTTLLAITYLLKENSNTDIFSNSLTSIIKDRIGAETKSLATKTNDIFFRTLRHNIYRKNDNLLFVCEAFVSFPKKKKNNGTYKELLSDCQKSDILLKAIKFDGLSLEEFAKSKTINNYFLEEYNPSYFSENLDVIKTLRWIYKNCSKVNKYGFVWMIRGIYNNYFYDVIEANCFKVKLIKETYDYSPKFFISLFRLLYALDNVATDDETLRSVLSYDSIEYRVRRLGQKFSSQIEKLLFVKYLTSIAVFLNKHDVVLKYLDKLKRFIISDNNDDVTNSDDVSYYSIYYYYQKLAEIYNSKDDIDKANDSLLKALEGAYNEICSPSKRENRILTIFLEMIIYNKKHNNLDYVKDIFEKEALKMENTKFSYSIALKENFDKLLTKSKGE